MSAEIYQELESHLLNWGLNDTNLRAIIIIGSRARFPPPDIYADLDIILFTFQPEALTENIHWLSPTANPWISSLNYTTRGDPEWVVIYEDGIKLDLVISKASKQDDLLGLMSNSPYAEVFARGYRILLDKSGSKEQKFLDYLWSPFPPNPETFSETFDNVLIAIFRAAKFNKRDDLWRAQLVLGEIRQVLLKFIEWHALSGNESHDDIWYDGRAINSWARSPAIEMLPGLFPSYAQIKISDALRVALDMLNRLSSEVAHDRKFPFPNQGQAKLVAWLYEFVEKKP